MSYIDGFVIACPEDKKQAFIDHARLGDSVFMDLGATRIVECWGDDVPDGKTTDFRMDDRSRQGRSADGSCQESDAVRWEADDIRGIFARCGTCAIRLWRASGCAAHALPSKSEL
jgi:uncharacterized protein YbaA (DUF1428 family)